MGFSISRLIPRFNQWFGSGLGKKPDPGLYTSNEGVFLKFYKSLLFCFLTYGVSPLYSLEPWIWIRIQWIRIRIHAGFMNLGHQWNVWHQKHEHKKEGFWNYPKYSFNSIKKISFHSRYRPRVRFFCCQNRIHIPGFN